MCGSVRRISATPSTSRGTALRKAAPSTGDLDSDASDADRQAARARAEAEQAEAQKRERRIVVNLNKLGAAATGVRRQFVTTLLARKTLPKGAASFVADCLARDSYMLTQHNRDEVAAELLGIDAAKVHAAVSDLPASSDNRALVIALGLVLGALEARTGKDAWPNPAPVREPGDDRIYYGHSVTSGDYLRFLAANGYTLAPVEEVITGTRTAANTYDTYLRERRIQPPTSNSPVGNGAGSTRAGPTPRPGSPAHIQRSRRRRRPTMPKRLRRCCSVCLSGSASVTGGPLHARPRPALAAAPGGTRDHRRAGSSPSGCSPPSAARRRCRA